MRNTIVIAVSSVAVIITLFINFKNFHAGLTEFLKPGKSWMDIKQANCWHGTPAILGSMLEKFYGGKSTLYIPLEKDGDKDGVLWRHHLNVLVTLKIFSYPIAVKSKSYGWHLNADEFKELSLLSFHTGWACKNDMVRFFLVGNSSEKKNEELGLFFYRDNVMVIPVDGQPTQRI